MSSGLGGVLIISAAAAGTIAFNRGGKMPKSPSPVVPVEGATVNRTVTAAPQQNLAQFAEQIMLAYEQANPGTSPKDLDQYWDCLLELAEQGNSAALNQQYREVFDDPKKSTASEGATLGIGEDDFDIEESECFPSADPSEAEEQQLLIAERIEEALSRRKMHCAVLRRYEGWSFDRYVVTVQDSTPYNKVKTAADDLMVGLGLSLPPIITTTSEGSAIDVPRDVRRWPQLRDHLDAVPDEDGIWVPIGVTAEGECQQINLANPSTSHWLIAGTSGGGKSVTVLSILQALEKRYPDRVSVFGVDPKKLEAPHWERQSIVKSVCSDPESAIQFLRDLNNQRKSREANLAKLGKRSVEGDRTVKHLIYLCDEFAELSVVPKDLPEAESRRRKALAGEFNQLVDEIGRLGRATGIHLILVTQSPRADVITTSIRDQLSVRICLLVASQEISNVILSEKGPGRATRLLGQGDLILKAAGIDTRLQCFTPEGV